MSVVIRLQYLPLTANASDIRTYFQGLRIPDGAVHIIGGDDGDAFIIFASDEDARQAMKRDRGRIHQTEIRLQLSSKAEMNEIVERAKAGLLPKKPSPPPRVPPQDPSWSSPAPPNPYAASPEYGNKPAYQRTAPVAAPVTAVAPPEPSPPVRERDPPRYPRTAPGRINDEYRPSTYPDDRRYRPTSDPERNYNGRAYEREREGGYRRSLDEEHRKYLDGRDERGPRSTMESEKYSPRAPEYRQEPPIDPNDAIAKLPPSLRPPYGIPPPHLRHLFPNFNDQRAARPPDLNRRNSPPQRPFRSPPPERRASPPRAALPVPVRNESWRDAPPAKSVEKAWAAEPPKASQSHPGRKPLLGAPAANSSSNSSLDERIPQDRSTFDERNRFGGAKSDHRGPEPISRYIELSRLPSDMLRPTVLESFIKPSVPLTLTSVKAVYNRDGVHVHTLVRLETDSDASKLLRKDGEQGIRVRPTTKTKFDEAIDGPLGAATINLAPLPTLFKERDGRKGDREEDRRRRRSRSYSPRRAKRGGRRSRSPPRRRRRSRSRSPPRPKGRQEPNRWCLMLTNVPFKISEEELRGWFSERVKPMKLARTHYSDGNASDRWVAEFESESLMNRAKGLRTMIQGRSIRMTYIDNDFADSILAIEDKYGEEKKNENEMKQLAEIQLQKLNQLQKETEMMAVSGIPIVPSDQASLIMGTTESPKAGAVKLDAEKPILPPTSNPVHAAAPATVPIVPPRSYPMGPPSRGRGMNGPPSNFGRPVFFANPAPPVRHSHPGPAGPMQLHANHGPTSLGFFRGGGPPRGRGRGAPFGYRPPPIFHNGPAPNGGPHQENGFAPSAPQIPNFHTENEKTSEQMEIPIGNEVIPVDPELVHCLGGPGCVIACKGFPADVTLQDIVSFFKDYKVDENSVRIRMIEGDAPTGESVLAVDSAEAAKSCVASLNGKSLRGHVVHLCVANATQ